VRVQRRPMAMAMASGCWLWPKAIGEQCASHKGQSRKACRADPHKETLTPIRKNLWRNWSKRYGATEARATEWKKEPSRQWKTRRKRKTRKNGKDVQSEKEWGKPWKRGVDRCLEAARGRVERSGARKYVERGMTCGGVWRWVRSVRWLVRWCAVWPCRRLGGLGKKNGGRSDGANRDGGASCAMVVVRWWSCDGGGAVKWDDHCRGARRSGVRRRMGGGAADGRRVHSYSRR
jgi:hypothetical protein